jgi:hypothetical protein
MESDPILTPGHRRLARLVDAHMTNLRHADPALDRLLHSLQVLGSVAVAGGACVAWWHGTEPRDIDLVVDAPADAINALIEKHGAPGFRRTAFGGWKLTAAGVAVDLWPLAETWSIKREHREPSLRALIDLVTFDWSGIAVVLDGGDIVEAGWFAAMETKRLDLRYDAWPYAFMLAGKALSLYRTLGAQPTPKLRAWIRTQRAEPSFTERQWRDAAVRYAPDLDLDAFFAALDRLADA